MLQLYANTVYFVQFSPVMANSTCSRNM